jgi:NADH-quinone oxidoreductase subunit N
LETIGLLSVLYGTFFAYYQTRVKSLLAVSSIINMGYLCLSLSLHSLLGFFAAFNYLFTYCFTTFGLFFVLLAFATKRGSLTRLTDVAVVLRTQGLLGWLLALTLLSAAGMPPLPGFFPKLLVM